MLVNIPEDLYERLQTIAVATNRAFDDILVSRLKSTLSEPLPALPPDEQAELDALRFLSDDTLWTLAAEQMPKSAQARMQVLMDRNSDGTITDAEYTELEGLVERGNRLMVRKAEASVILMERGHAFTQDDFTHKHE
jgi:hypothetical protein